MEFDLAMTDELLAHLQRMKDITATVLDPRRSYGPECRVGLQGLGGLRAHARGSSRTGRSPGRTPQPRMPVYDASKVPW